MFYYKQFNSPEELKSFRTKIRQNTKPIVGWPFLFGLRNITPGFYLKMSNYYINIMYDEGHDLLSMHGDPLDMHFYGLFIHHKNKTALIGAILPDIEIVLLLIMALFFDHGYVFVISVLLLTFFLCRKDYAVIKNFADKNIK